MLHLKDFLDQNMGLCPKPEAQGVLEILNSLVSCQIFYLCFFYFFIRNVKRFKDQNLAQELFSLTDPLDKFFPFSSDHSRCRSIVICLPCHIPPRASCILVPPCLLFKSSASDSLSFHAILFLSLKKVQCVSGVINTLYVQHEKPRFHHKSISSEQQPADDIWWTFVRKLCHFFSVLKSYEKAEEQYLKQ